MPALSRPASRSAARIAAALAASDPVLARVIEAAGPYRLVPERDRSPYEHLARAIAHQQLNGKAASIILRRFIALYGDGRFPAPQEVLATPVEALRACGFSQSKIAALRDLSARALEGVVPDRTALDALDDASIVARLTQVRGVGRWTVQMMLIFHLGRRDVLPVEDFGVRNGFRLAYGLGAPPAPRALAEFGVRWAPHRTAAAWYLWRAVDLARDGRLPPPPRPAPRLKRAAAARARR